VQVAIREQNVKLSGATEEVSAFISAKTSNARRTAPARPHALINVLKITRSGFTFYKIRHKELNLRLDLYILKIFTARSVISNFEISNAVKVVKLTLFNIFL
jgi:hypothetical protein